MKKLLLLLMAILLFAPPRAKAEDETTTKVVTILDAQSGNPNWITVPGTDELREYILYIMEERYIGVWGGNESWSPYYSKNGNNVVQLRYHNPATSDYDVLPPTLNNFYIDFKLNGAWGGCKISKTQNPNFYFNIEAGTEIKFYTEGDSKITGVELRTIDAAELSNLTAVDNTATKTEADGKATFTAANGSEFITIKNSGSGNVRLTGIVVSVEEPNNIEFPATPTVDQLTFGSSIASWDRANRVLKIYGAGSFGYPLHITDESIAELKNAKYVGYTWSEKALPVAPYNGTDGFTSNYSGGNSRAGHVGDANDATTYNQWVKYQTDRTRITMHKCTPKLADLPEDEGEPNILRIASFNENSVSKRSLDIKVIFKRLPHPTVNVDRTVTPNNGVSYDPVTKTITFEGDEATVYFETGVNPNIKQFTGTNDALYYRYLQTEYKVSENGDQPIFKTPLTQYTENYYDPEDGRSIVVKIDGLQPGESRKIAIKSQFVASYGPETYSGKTISITYPDTNNGQSEIITVKRVAPQPRIIEGASTTPLIGGIKGYVGDELAIELTVAGGTIEYQFIPEVNNTFAQVPVNSDWKDNITTPLTKISGNGRLFVKTQGSDEYIYRDYQQLPVTSVPSLNRDDLLGLSDAATAITISEPVRVIGFFPLSDDNTNSVYLMFVADKGKNVLRVHIEGNEKDIKKFDEAYKGYKLIDGLTGVLRKNKEMPELYVNSPSLDYSAFISEPYDAPADYPAYEPEFVQRVPVISDYSKLMYFGPLRWNATEKTFYDNDNNTVKLYQRIATDQTVEEFEEELIDGVQYRIAGYVGYADGAPVILPRAYVAAPLLRAPNPINDEAMPDTLIEMNVISNELELSVNSKGIANNTELQYILCDDKNPIAENDERWNEKSDKYAAISIPYTETITIKDDLADGDCTIAARLAAGTMYSGVVTVRFNKVKVADTFDKIADFKTAANNIEKLPSLDSTIGNDHTFYQYTGYARVREITPNYIYIRTTDKDGKDLDEEDKQNRSDNSILIYNKNGWNQDVVSVEEDGTIVSGTRAPLQVGDIITNFALIPTQSGFGNLVANATDFIRTFRRLDGVTGGTVMPIELNAQDNDVPKFTEADRMLRYSIKNVTISRTANNGAGIQRDVPADDQDVISYTYTLNIPGKPILDNGSVFDANPDWDVMWSESALFNLQGVVMLADGSKEIASDGTYPDGRYMLAVIPDSIKFSNVATPRAPSITLSGVGAKDGSFVTKATVTIKSTTAENSENAVIIYTTDGSDPRLSSSKRFTYTGPFEIDANTVVKAYVRSNGTPNSELADTLFTRTAVDTRYIMNFISQA
ncbi:MAG: chitobiase/beta-hexosaminidase C-terminal domain-containing protein, partial [Paramuribaculum sp.]|nr:chitobiase/beta-hexosaminidase C-terminal domain-containing protein [Paramuribaculum sp.]